VKLETTLKERPGFLHALPLFDLFMTVTMLLLLGPMFLTQSGISVELPVSQFQLQRYQKAVVVTLSAGISDPQIYLGRRAVSAGELREHLDELKADDAVSVPIVLLKTDVGSSVKVQGELVEMILLSGFKLALVGESNRMMEEDYQPDE
jgi:biopolymer transport protein ExbD